MQRYIAKLTNYCVANGIITQSAAHWFQYGIERRLVTLLVGVPFFIFATLLTDFSTAVSFFISFYMLRSRTNGFHAKTIWGCLAISLVLECIFLAILHQLLILTTVCIINTICVIIVFIFAPFNHSAMQLQGDEFRACRTSSRIRVCILAALGSILYFGGATTYARGITLGIAMAAFLLCLAYILNGGIHNEQASGEN